MEYILDHITKENWKWFAEVKDKDITIREHTGDKWGWNGMSYSSLQCILSEYYNIQLPCIKELHLLKKTSNRLIYTMQIEI